MVDVFADIDAAFAEDEFERDPIRLKLGGHVWTFPGVMPAMALMRLSRWEADGRAKTSVEGLDVGDLTVGEQVALIGDLVPDDVLRGWASNDIGLTDPRVERLIEVLLVEYMRRMEAAHGGEGKALPDPTASTVPPTTPDLSSVTGVSSRPTSPGNTVSPFPGS